MEGAEKASSISYLTSGLQSVIGYVFGSESNEVETSSESENKVEEKKVCKFYLEGKCRFGNECHNLHPEEISANIPKQSAKKKPERKEMQEKPKKRMKPAIDVIHRIQWDPNLSQEFFYIGYIDRFKGVIEEPFSMFSNWGDLANAEYDALAIPQHRIQYFKYKDTKVWDKNERIDEMFGSTGSEVGDVMKFIDTIDARIEENLRNKSYNLDNSDGDDSDSASDSDDDIQINIDSGIMAETRVNMVPDEERSTHFLAIKISNCEVVEKAREIQSHIVEQEEALSDCCMKLGLFHITIGMLRLPNDEGIKEAINLVNELQPTLKKLSEEVTLSIDGLDTFGQRVLYAKVEPKPEDKFWMFISEIQNKIAETSSNVIVTNKFEFTPHMTILKVNRVVSRLRKSKYLPSSLYEKYQNANFGQQNLNNVQLCVIEASTRFDGFYRTLNEIVI